MEFDEVDPNFDKARKAKNIRDNIISLRYIQTKIYSPIKTENSDLALRFDCFAAKLPTNNVAINEHIKAILDLAIADNETELEKL